MRCVMVYSICLYKASDIHEKTRRDSDAVTKITKQDKA